LAGTIQRYVRLDGKWLAVGDFITSTVLQLEYQCHVLNLLGHSVTDWGGNVPAILDYAAHDGSLQQQPGRSITTYREFTGFVFKL